MDPTDAVKVVLALVKYCRCGLCQDSFFRRLSPEVNNCTGAFLLKDITSHSGFLEVIDDIKQILERYLKEEKGKVKRLLCLLFVFVSLMLLCACSSRLDGHENLLEESATYSFPWNISATKTPIPTISTPSRM